MSFNENIINTLKREDLVELFNNNMTQLIDNRFKPYLINLDHGLEYFSVRIIKIR